MKEDIRNTELAVESIAANAASQGTFGAGGKSVSEMTDRPYHVYVGVFQCTGKAYDSTLSNRKLDG